MTIGHFSNSAKLCRNIKIPRKRPNYVARLKIPWLVENCLP